MVWSLTKIKEIVTPKSNVFTLTKQSPKYFIQNELYPQCSNQNNVYKSIGLFGDNQ